MCIDIGSQFDGYLTMKNNDAKECALILVDEIIAHNPVVRQMLIGMM